MRKQVFGRQLNRTKNQRQALFRGLINALIVKGEIETTLPKAKSIISQTEKLITKAKSGTLNDRRILFRFLNKRNSVNRLVEEIAPLFKERNGGYLRLVRVGQRKGDQAEIARVSFTENVEPMVKRQKQETKVLEKAETKEKTAEEIKEIKEVEVQESNEKPRKKAQKKEARENK
ncbi:50S ribosomal protein L17 [Candidatus Microgenomates bacterium]|jgi:large subunit ribosomal protein L17|nr:MAG: 50S ribosomal protein L17 [Candidatus Microgenomates bacterium]